jgi:hypothetical protein
MQSRHDDAYLDDDDMVPDGHSVKVRLELMDALQRQVAFNARDHQPHHAELTDEVRQLRAATRDAYIQQITTAWSRRPGRVQDTVAPEPRDNLMRPHLSFADAQSLREKAYADYVERISNGWRAGRTDPRAATAIERQGEQWRGGR